jgi:hypothetical protein
MANYTAVAAGGDWNVSTTWSPVGVPTSLDTAILNSASGNVTVPALGSNCVTLTLTGYTGTLLLNGNLTIATSGLNLGSFTGTINFNAGDIILPDGLFNLGNASIYTTLGTGGVRITKPSASFSIFNTNNKIWNCKFALGAAGSTSPTIYFEDNPLEVTGLVSFQATTTGTINLISADIFTPNLVFLKMSGNFTISGSTIYTTTTSSQNIGITGSSNQTLTASGTHQLRCPLRIDKTGGVLTLSGTLNYNTGTLTYVASGGTVNAGSSTLNIGASATLNTNGITWSNISAGLTFSNPTITLSSNLTWSGTMSLINNTLGVSGATRTVTFSGSSLTSLSTASIDIGNTGFASFGGASIINFPSSTVLSITNLNIGCGGFSSGAYNTSANNVTFNISGNLTLNTSNGAGAAPRFNGTSSQINIIGNSTITNNRIGGTSTYLAIPTFTINTPNTVTFSSNDANTFYFESSTITYTSGTLTGATCVFITSTLNLNTGGKWGTDVVIRGNTTLTSNATFGNLTTNTNNVGLTGAFTINVEGNLAINVATGGASTPIVLNGTGSQSWTHAGAVYLSTNLTINKASGTLTIGTLALPNVYYSTNTLNYIASGGTVDVTTNSSTLNIGGNTTLNTNGITWYNFTIRAASILTLSSDFTWSNDWTIPTTYTTSFAVSAGNLTPTSTANINFTAAQVTLKNDITINNVTRNGGRLDNNKINITGNLSVVTTNTTAGTTTFEISGTGNQTWTSTAYLSNPTIINKPSGTLILGAATYHGANFTYTQGDIDFTTNNNTFFVIGGTYNVSGLNFNTFLFATSGANSITLASDLRATAFTQGGNGVINGLFNIYSQTLNINNSTSGASVATISFNGIFYCSGDCTFSGAGNTCRITGDLYVSGSCYHNAPASASQGAANLYMVGNGELRAPSTLGTFVSNLYFNTSGKITITGSVSYALGAARTISLIRGNVEARKATLTLNRAFTHTLTNMNKIVWGNVVLDTVSVIGLNMNEFFCGDATTRTNITTNNAAINATVTFTDNFEKIAKFINVNGVTFTRPQQLLLLTNQPKKSRNIGIRYNNQSPNGTPKNDPSVQNQMTYSVPKYLVGDPNMIKSM